MNTWLPAELLYPASGFAVGLLVGMTGVGGGSLMTPLLILLFGIHPASAVGTDLLYAAATKTGGSLIHGFSRTVEWKIVGRLATGSVPASAACLIVLSRFDLSGAAARAAITTVLGVGLYPILRLSYSRWQPAPLRGNRVAACLRGRCRLVRLWPRRRAGCH